MTPRLTAVWALTASAAVLSATSSGPQAPPAAQGQAAAPQTPGQQVPTFRTDIDVIRLDVSVLDKDRKPVLGLTADDFTVTEDGKAQRIVAVTAVDSFLSDPMPSPWMRHVPADVATNDLVDQVGDGRVVAVVIDDHNLPWDDIDYQVATREAARYTVDSLGPSDSAAVVYTLEAGRTEDFTADRAKLLAAIDRYNPREPEWFVDTPIGPGPGGGDLPQRFSPALMRTRCQRVQPLVPTLSVLANRLAAIPNRRKTIVLLSPGAPVGFSGRGGGCATWLAEELKDMYRVAQRANINIYGIDPAGYGGYAEYLMKPIRRGGRAARPMSQGAAEAAARTRRDFLEVTANHTGARAFVTHKDQAFGIEQIFVEDSSYYLVGYQSTNGAPDGKFRKVDVKVRRPGVTVRARSGYYAADGTRLEARETQELASSNDLGLSGLTRPTGLPLRAMAPVLARAGSGDDRRAIVGLVLTARLPAPPRAISETLTVVRNTYDASGAPGPPVRDSWTLALSPPTGDVLHYDVTAELTLPPGRYQIRLNGTSAALDRSGSVYADVDVPDLSRASVALTSVVLGTEPDPAAPRTDALAPHLPLLPTTERRFQAGEPLAVFARVYQGGAVALADVTVTVKVSDNTDRAVIESALTLTPSDFDDRRGAPARVGLPLDRLVRGPYVVSVSAARPGSAPVRRDVLFRIR
jgi:VWFA-related protein